ncbi:MAG: HYR domain-containing protein [Lewinellaceae bacterium]|nr:HYR domain-containing protein [Lewinellaceae bacterium]
MGNTDNVCGQTFTINNVTNNCGNTFSWFRPLASDLDFTDCSAFLNNGNGGITESFTPPPGQGQISVPPFNYNSIANTHPTAFFPVGNTVVTYTATDVANNTVTCSFTVKVVDVQAPVLTCPANQTLSTTCATDPLPDYRNLVFVSDNCASNVMKVQSPMQGVALSTIFGATPAAGQQTTITVTGTDLYPNNLTGSCSFVVTLADGNAPIPVDASLAAIESFVVL